MKMTQILKSVWLVSFSTDEDLALSFLRFQEHYESPEFRGKFFSLEEFKAWYSKQYGSFSYVSDWSGFNIPSSIFEPFRQGKFDPLSERESILLNAFGSVEPPFYIIGTNNKDEALDHETCHALFYVDPQYREACSSLIIKHRNELNSIFNKINNLGYHDAVAIDEAHAYCSANPDWLLANGIACDPNITKQLRLLKLKAELDNKI